jgi:hypothetical protein
MAFKELVFQEGHMDKICTRRLLVFVVMIAFTSFSIFDRERSSNREVVLRGPYNQLALMVCSSIASTSISHR